MLRFCEIRYKFNYQGPKSSSKHTSRSTTQDELEMIGELKQADLFTHVAGRHHISFPDIKRSPWKYLNINKFDKWLLKHIEQISDA